MIREWPITEVLQKVKYSSDYDDLESSDQWLNMMRKVLADRQIPTIIDAIQRNGFIDPICITEGSFLGNGHHRLCVMILMGAETILVDDSNWMSRESEAHGTDILYSPLHDSEEAAWIASHIDEPLDAEAGSLW
jgi:hypothetical protein